MQIEAVAFFIGSNILTFSLVMMFMGYRRKKKDESLQKHLLYDRKVKYNDAPKALRDHSKIFDPAEVILVNDNIHVAIGYSISNCILIEGKIMIYQAQRSLVLMIWLLVSRASFSFKY